MTRCVQKYARLQMVTCVSVRDKKVSSETSSSSDVLIRVMITGLYGPQKLCC